MKLHTAFNITRGDVVALVGAGGKTSTLIALAHELTDEGWRVLATTTTRIGDDQLRLMPHAVRYDAGASAITASMAEDGFAFAYSDVRGGKVYGPPPEWFGWALDADVLLIEADGARGLPLKAPYEHEPVIPPETTLVIPIASLSVLGQPLDSDHVYNPEAMIERYGFYEGSPVRSPWVAQVLRDDELGLRGVPEKARVIVLLNAAPPSGYLRLRAHLIARMILRSPRISGVAVGSSRAADPISEVQRPVGAIVLAAGMSTRMGQSKPMLPWANGKLIIEHIIDQLILARIDNIMVVTGYRAEEVSELATKRGANVVFNRHYATGEMLSSLKAGLKAQPANVAAALVVLGDQPRIQPKIVGQVTMAYAEGRGDLVAPSYQMRRGHPILIDRRYWSELLALPDDGAPRDVISQYPVYHINVDTDSVLRDVDTPDDYQSERSKAGLK
ncbi:MAG: putative selenium-dependent hydroxylase accessory protein YqeC [Anaerolineae bacterium]|nr:putative selenium-dependent hydroxylase accessory protein YqeC [Anaerolineae bacterium]